MSEKKIGMVEHFFDKVSVAAIKVTAALKVGETIHFKGPSTDFIEKVTSMQINRVPIEKAKKGDDLGIKVSKPVKPNDEVFLVKE